MTNTKTDSDGVASDLDFLANFGRLRREKAGELRKLDDAVVKTARAAFAGGASVNDLMEATGASETTAREWLKPGKPDWDETPAVRPL